MLKVEFSKKADEKYTQIGQYIAKDNLFYANEVLNKIDNSIATLCSFPFIGKNMGNNVRLIVEPKYKFKIVYSLNKGHIYILAIFKYKNSWE